MYNANINKLFKENVYFKRTHIYNFNSLSLSGGTYGTFTGEVQTSL